MAISIRQFNEELYIEHLEEASFLYEQRNAYLTDPEVPWRDLGTWDDRLEAHIDALVVGGQLALAVCDERAKECDAGELNAVMRVYCRQRAEKRALALLSALDPADEEKAHAMAVALRHEMPTEWHDQMHGILKSSRAELKAVAAHVLGYRRLGAREALAAELADSSAEATSRELAWALGRCGDRSGWAVLTPLLQQDDSAAPVAALSLLRLGDAHPVKAAHLGTYYHRWPRTILGLGGGPGAVRPLVDALKSNGEPDVVIALGILGSLAAVQPLLDCLADETLGACAATALELITGAHVSEEVFVADDIDPDELFDDEREQFEADGTVPTRDGDRPFGSDETHLSLNRELWEQWLNTNKARFNQDTRYRNGQPYSAQILVDNLQADSSPYALRSAAYEELVVRYGLDVPFEADLPIPQQLQMIDRIKAWVRARAGVFEDGKWYFQGNIQL